MDSFLQHCLRFRGGRTPDRRPIGLPRALFYFLHPALWETFFRETGFPVVLSAPTDRCAVERAGLISEPEHCLPVKMLDAHLDALKTQVERVFVPRILSMRKGKIACPKLGALPDSVRAQFGEHFQVLTIDVNEDKIPLDKTLLRLGRRLGISGTMLSDAIRRAMTAMDAALDTAARPPPQASAAKDKPFVLIGHPYNLDDDYMSGPVFRKLESLGATVQRIGFERQSITESPLQWDTCSVMHAKVGALEAGACAGVIVLSSFNCGCDSIAGSLLRKLAKARRIPFMTLVIDEHSAQAGLATRLEAFVDSIGVKH